MMVPGANGEAGAFEAVAQQLVAHHAFVILDNRLVIMTISLS
jgi:hypothetical protein